VVTEALAAPKTPEPNRLLLIRAIGQGGLDVVPDRWLKGPRQAGAVEVRPLPVQGFEWARQAAARPRLS
jgi:hypothetical protein